MKQVYQYLVVAMLLLGSSVAAQAGGHIGLNEDADSVYCLQSGTNTVVVTDPIMFYDDGGPDEKYTKGFTGTVTFKPGIEGYAVVMDTKVFALGSGKFYLYHGSAIDDSKLEGGNYFSTTKGPQNVISTADDGALTVDFQGYKYSSSSGWAIDVRLHKLTAHTLDSVGCEAVTTDPVLRDATDAPFVKTTIKLGGDRNALKFNNFTFSLAGTTATTDVTAARLYYTDTNNAFKAETLVGELTSISGNTFTITLQEPLAVSGNGEHYLWLALDVAAGATAGNVIDVTLNSLNCGDNLVNVTPVKVERVVKAGLSGNYIIGSSSQAHYATFAAATADLAGGVEGPVTFLVEDGTYAENVIITAPGAGEDKPVTFTGISGDASKVSITGAGYTDTGYANRTGMVKIDSTSYVTLKNMSFVPTDQDFPFAIQVYNQSRHVTLDSIIVTANSVTSGYSGMALVKGQAKDEEDKNNDYLTISNSTFTGGYIALYLGGTSYVRYSHEKGLVVKNNVISEAGSKGIYVSDEDDALIQGNTVTQSTTTKTGYTGIDIYRNRGKFIVADNVVTNSQSAYSYGLYIRQECRGNDNDPALVYNNAISITNSPSANTMGLSANTDSRNIHFYYNTVRVAGSKGFCYKATNPTTSYYTGMAMYNNLFQNLTASAAMSIGTPATYVPMVDFKHNAFYATDSLILDGYNLAAFNTLAGDETSIIDSAQFVAETDLTLRAAGNLMSALPIDAVTTDIKGRTRNATTPTIGAYEYVDLASVKPEMIDGYPVVVSVSEFTATVKTQWNVTGKLYSKAVRESEVSNMPRKAAPTADDLLATTATDASAETDVLTTFTDLEDNTPYVAYFMLVSALDGQQSDIDTVHFTTLRYIDSLIVELPQRFDTISAGSNTTLAALVVGGDLPYTYVWTDQMGNQVGTDSTVTVRPQYTWGYRLTVTSADGQTATAKTGVIVNGDMYIASFEDNYLDDESFFIGDYSGDEFYSGSFAFKVNHNYYGKTEWWDGYALSNQTSNSFSALTDQYHSAAGGGNESDNFCIGFPDGYSIEVTHNPDGDIIPGVMVTNTAYVATSLRNGDSFSKKFVQGDSLVLVVTGKHADGSTSKVTMFLADFRDTNESNHYILDTWKWLDLSPLGTVKSLVFSLVSSDNGKWGMNTPAYVALEDLGIGDPTSGITDATVGNKIVSVDYYDVNGHRFDRPIEGVNIIVTTYNDGTRRSSKAIF